MRPPPNRCHSFFARFAACFLALVTAPNGPLVAQGDRDWHTISGNAPSEGCGVDARWYVRDKRPTPEGRYQFWYVISNRCPGTATVRLHGVNMSAHRGYEEVIVSGSKQVQSWTFAGSLSRAEVVGSDIGSPSFRRRTAYELAKRVFDEWAGMLKSSALQLAGRMNGLRVPSTGVFGQYTGVLTEALAQERQLADLLNRSTADLSETISRQLDEVGRQLQQSAATLRTLEPQVVQALGAYQAPAPAPSPVPVVSPTPAAGNDAVQGELDRQMARLGMSGPSAPGAAPRAQAAAVNQMAGTLSALLQDHYDQQAARRQAQYEATERYYDEVDRLREEGSNAYFDFIDALRPEPPDGLQARAAAYLATVTGEPVRVATPTFGDRKREAYRDAHRQCRQGERAVGIACVRAGNYLQAGGMTAEADKYYGFACELDEGVGCAILARNLAQRQEWELARGVLLHGRGCRSAEAWACIALYRTMAGSGVFQAAPAPSPVAGPVPGAPPRPAPPPPSPPPRAARQIQVYSEGVSSALADTVMAYLSRGVEIKSLTLGPGGSFALLFGSAGFHSNGLSQPVLDKMWEVNRANGTLQAVALSPAGTWAVLNDNRGYRTHADTAFNRYLGEEVGAAELSTLALGPHGRWVIARRDAGVVVNSDGPLFEVLKANHEGARAPITHVALFGTEGYVVVLGTQGSMWNQAPPGLIAALKEAYQRGWLIRGVSVSPEGGWMMITSSY